MTAPTITPNVLAAVDALLPANRLTGARYSASAQAQIDTELLPVEAIDGGA